VTYNLKMRDGVVYPYIGVTDTCVTASLANLSRRSK
jgi:hypothetical protein